MTFTQNQMLVVTGAGIPEVNGEYVIAGTEGGAPLWEQQAVAYGLRPDHRIRFPSGPLDFEEHVGLTGQPHDNFPAPGQARYDWMRMTLIGLLSNQSSFDEPINYRLGTIWCKLGFTDEGCLCQRYHYYDGTEFAPLSQAIEVVGKTLSEWAEHVNESIERVTVTSTFSGSVEAHEVSDISIPMDARLSASEDVNRPIMFRNGLLIDPRLTEFNVDRTRILLLSDPNIGDATLRRDDKYTIIIDRIDVLVPETIVAS
jgi:hypothetical protein